MKELAIKKKKMKIIYILVLGTVYSVLSLRAFFFAFLSSVECFLV